MTQGDDHRIKLANLFNHIDKIIHQLKMYARGEQVHLESISFGDYFDRIVSLVILPENDHPKNREKLLDYYRQVQSLYNEYVVDDSPINSGAGATSNKEFKDLLIAGEQAIHRELAAFLERQRLIGEHAEYPPTEEEPSNEEPQQPTIPSIRKLKWLGSTAQFGFIIDLLIQGGYLEKPTASFDKDAAFFLEHFEIGGTKATLAKELSERTNSIATSNRKKIDIPHKDQLA